MAALNAENEGLKQQLLASNGQINTLNSEKTKLENEIKELKQQKAHYEQYHKHELEMLKQQLNERDVEITESRKTVNSLEQQLQNEKQENLDNVTLIIEQNDNIKTLTDEIKQHQFLDELQRKHIHNYRESTVLQLNNATEVREKEILDLTHLVNELENELEVEKALSMEHGNIINEQQNKIVLLTEELEQIRILEEMQQKHIKNIRESGVINVVEDISEFAEELQREQAMNMECRKEISMQKNKNKELQLEIASMIESKLKSMEMSCRALEQLRNAIKYLEKQNRNQHLQVEQHAVGVLGPLSYHLVDVSRMNK